jgi:hypothetical protein
MYVNEADTHQEIYVVVTKYHKEGAERKVHHHQDSQAIVV